MELFPTFYEWAKQPVDNVQILQKPMHSRVYRVLNASTHNIARELTKLLQPWRYINQRQFFSKDKIIFRSLGILILQYWYELLLYYEVVKEEYRPPFIFLLDMLHILWPEFVYAPKWNKKKEQLWFKKYPRTIQKKSF